MSATQNTDWTITLVNGRPDQDLLRRITALAAEAEDSDGNPPLSDQTIVELRTGEASEGLMVVTAWLCDDDGAVSGELVGVAVAVSTGDPSPGALPA